VQYLFGQSVVQGSRFFLDGWIARLCETGGMFRKTIHEGVELRLLEERNADEVFAVVDRNREYLGQWLPWVEGSRSPADVKAFIGRARRQFAANEGFHLAIWQADRLVGMVGLKPINWADSKVEIGYWLDAEAQGRGLITMACRAVIDHLFDELELNRVEIRVALGNAASLAVARRLGAVSEGIERESFRIQGRLVDIERFAILRREWVKC